ncbi:MAG: membrane protein insertase YidC [Candidatus Fermentibacteraceae bacterium]|nr:membrane protein insertase YidC [Candidatus Fermentibacteraceae bacterium]MBN2609642.1 membrane protein insertase YidC [Candidatus Fermentibacteraceae bacterium]
MSDQKRLLLAAALMALVLFVSWQFMGRQSERTTVQTGQGTAVQAQQQVPVITQADSSRSDTSLQSDTTSRTVIADDSLGVGNAEPAVHEERIIHVVIRDEGRDIVAARISTLSGSIESWRLMLYENLTEESDGRRIDLGGATWIDQGWGFETSAPDTVFVEEGVRSVFLTEISGERSIEYTFTPGFYGFHVQREGYDQVLILNSGIIPITESKVTPGSYFKAQWNAEKIRSRDTEDIEMNDQVGNVQWISARTKYFGIILLPRSYERAYGYVYGPGGDVSPSIGIQDNNVLVYAGPLDYGTLRELGSNTHLMVDFGWPVIRDIGRLLFWFCTAVLSFVGNWGLKIIILSVVLKVVLMPLTTKSFRSMAKLKQVQPKMKELQEKYRSDPKALQSAMQKLYREEGVNPLGGCLPMLMQMPVFFALYRVLANSVQLRGADFMLWIRDLSTPEILIPFQTPMLGLDGIGLLAVLMGVSMFLQQKMTTVDQSQKSMTYILPVFMTYLFMRFPAGLTLYWFMNNILTIGHQKMINSKLEAEKQV